MCKLKYEVENNMKKTKILLSGIVLGTVLVSGCSSKKEEPKKEEKKELQDVKKDVKKKENKDNKFSVMGVAVGDIETKFEKSGLNITEENGDLKATVTGVKVDKMVTYEKIDSLGLAAGLNNATEYTLVTLKTKVENTTMRNMELFLMNSSLESKATHDIVEYDIALIPKKLEDKFKVGESHEYEITFLFKSTKADEVKDLRFKLPAAYDADTRNKFRSLTVNIDGLR